MAGEYNIEEVDGTQQRRDVIQRIIHEDYDFMTIDNDVCIVQVLEENSNFIFFDNAPNYLVGCVIQKRFGFETVLILFQVDAPFEINDNVLCYKKVSVPFVDESICEKSKIKINQVNFFSVKAKGQKLVMELENPNHMQIQEISEVARIVK